MWFSTSGGQSAGTAIHHFESSTKRELQSMIRQSSSFHALLFWIPAQGFFDLRSEVGVFFRGFEDEGEVLSGLTRATEEGLEASRSNLALAYVLVAVYTRTNLSLRIVEVYAGNILPANLLLNYRDTLYHRFL